MIQIWNNTQRSLNIMLADSECQLWNAVNKMPRSRVFALLWRLRVKNDESEETNFEISIIPLSVFILFSGESFQFSSTLLWSYPHIRCHPCPHCLRLTGRTSADQGLHCAQIVSVTDDTRLQITHISQHGKQTKCGICFCSVFVFHKEMIFAFTDLQ